MNKYLYLVYVTLLVSNMVSAQVSLLNAKSVDQIGKNTSESVASGNDTPLSYGYISDRDILWSKVVWEFIDLNQKINFPYYFPIDTANTSNQTLPFRHPNERNQKRRHRKCVLRFVFYNKSHSRRD